MTPSAFRDLRKRAGTLTTVARALGTTPRTLHACENDPEYPRRVLYAYAIKGVLHDRAAGLPPLTDETDVPPT